MVNKFAFLDVYSTAHLDGIKIGLNGSSLRGVHPLTMSR